MQYRRSSDSRPSADPHDRFNEVVMRRRCPGDVVAEVIYVIKLGEFAERESKLNRFVAYDTSKLGG